MKILVTGGAGFIGSAFVRLMSTSHEVIVLDSLTYAGNKDNLIGVPHTFIQGDITDELLVEDLVEYNDVIVNFAAESHVDRSIGLGKDFIDSNIVGVYTIGKAIRNFNPSALFIQVGTDEVYGSIHTGFSSEDRILNPSSLYSASKASGDLLALSFHRTYGLDVIVTRSTNNYGPRQYPEKLIPLFISKALKNERLPLYDDGSQIRDWLYVEDNCKAIAMLLAKGQPGEVYNIGSNQSPEVTNLELVRYMLNRLGKHHDLIEFMPGARPGHDQRYSVDTDKIRSLGWKPETNLFEGLDKTIDWYLQNPKKLLY